VLGAASAARTEAAVSILTDTLRRMTGAPTDAYTVGTVTYWADGQLKAVLDANVYARLVQIPVTPEETIGPDGSITVRQGRVTASGVFDTENVVIVDINGATINATIAQDGHVAFNEDVLSLVPLLSAMTYDLNAAAADVMEAWASAVKLGYDMETDGQTMSRSQRHDHLMEQAQAFRARGLPTSARMVRFDERRAGGSARLNAVQRAFDRVGKRW
jgi:hypothetical protein